MKIVCKCNYYFGQKVYGRSLVELSTWHDWKFKSLSGRFVVRVTSFGVESGEIILFTKFNWKNKLLNVKNKCILWHVDLFQQNYFFCKNLFLSVSILIWFLLSQFVVNIFLRMNESRTQKFNSILFWRNYSFKNKTNSESR